MTSVLLSSCFLFDEDEDDDEELAPLSIRSNFFAAEGHALVERASGRASG